MPSPTLQPFAIHYGLRLDASDEFVQGYLDGMRLDQRGQGVACGNSWIPRSKKCSPDKAKLTSKEAKARTVEKSKARAKLRGEVKAAKRQKARVKEYEPTTTTAPKMQHFDKEIAQKVAAVSEDEFIKKKGGSTVDRVFQRYTPEQRANLAASSRSGHRQREKVGEYYYTIQEKPMVAYPSRQRAARAQYQFYQSARVDAISHQDELAD